MIAFVAQKTSWSLDKLPFNWFDIALVLLLALGFWRGRKRGMSREFLPLSQCLVTLVGGSFGYALLGDWLIQEGVIKSVFGKNFNEQTAAYVSSYLAIAVVLFIVFSFIKRALKARLEGSNAFGGGEYYLGMIAGITRYAAFALILLALLKAPFYSAAEIAAHKKFMMDNFGLQGAQRGNFKSDDISGDYLPTVQTIQTGVFEDSLIGPFIKEDLSVLLINTTAAKKAARKSVHH